MANKTRPSPFKHRCVQIKLVRLDVADETMGLRYGQKFKARLLQASNGALFFRINLPEGTYYLRNDQVEKA